MYELCSKIAGIEGEKILQDMAKLDFGGVRAGAPANLANLIQWRRLCRPLNCIDRHFCHLRDRQGSESIAV